MTDTSRLSELSREQKRALAAELLRRRAQRPDTPFRLSHGQESLWFVHHLAPENAAYNLMGVAELAGEIDVPALRQSFRHLIERHELLRTSYAESESGLIQRVHDQQPVDFITLDARGWTVDERTAWLESEANRPFDLAQGQVLRVRLLLRDPGQATLLIAVHHIAVDFWSLQILLDELGIYYQAIRADLPPDLPSLTGNYRAFVTWQRENLESSNGQRLRAYWREQLAGELPVLDLPTDHARPPVQSLRGESVRFELAPELAHALRELARAEGVTLFATLLAGYVALLHRYSGQDDIIVGSPISGRTRAEFERVVGYFVNPVPLRTRLEQGITFRELLQQMRHTVRDALAHQEYPFPLMVEDVQPDRDMSRPPIFSAVFNWNQEQRSVDDRALHIQSIMMEQQGAAVDLMLMMTDAPDSLRGYFRYATDLFEAATIERLAGHFQTLLASAVAEPEQPIARLKLLTETERRQIVKEWNATETDYPKGQRLHDLFETQVTRTPDAVALVHGNESITYRELNTNANRLAHYLRDLGFGPGVLVGVCAARSIPTLTSLLAVLKAGGAYVPLDPTYPADRLAFMMDDAQVAVLLTESHLTDLLPEHQARTIRLDADAGLFSSQSSENLDGGAQPTDLAYVIYTSGSTGLPKGTLIEHRAVLNTIHWLQQQFQLGPDDVVAQKTSLSFTDSVWEIFWTLGTGARLVLFDDASVKDPRLLFEQLREHGVTMTQFVPAAMNSFLRAVTEWHGDETDPLPRLKWVFNGGEALPVTLAQEWDRVFRSARIADIYGMTESAIYATCYLTSPDKPYGNTTVFIGRPIANARTYILDRHGELCPAGVAGELHIGGTSLARGYLNRPELTAERFIADRFVPDPTARLYRTGDLARYLPDGTIEYLGRADHQVKIRGMRVEIGEVEEALSRHPAVKERVVVAREIGPGDRDLIAYLTTHGDTTPTTTELRRFLGQTLPDYMIPSAFVVLESLPLNPNGKIDRNQLPALNGLRPELARSFEAPRDDLQAKLAGVWADLLSVERVGIHDNFFELGGHSLLATRLASRLRSTFQVDVPLRDIFESPTIARLSERIRSLSQNSNETLPAITPMARDGDPPLSFAQQRLWFLDQIEPGNAAYNVPAAVRITGRLDIDSLQRGLNEIVRRHESLRTTIGVTDWQPVQVIAPEVTIRLAVNDLRTMPVAGREAEALRYLTHEARRPFDLSRRPLMRANLSLLGDDEAILLLTMHHIVSDGWSSNILVRELSAIYDAYRQGQPSPLAEPPVQYADYANWQRDWLDGERRRELLNFWTQRFRDVPPILDLSADRPRPAQQSFHGAQVEFELPAELSERLAALSRQEDATLYMALLAAFQTLLLRYTGQDDIAVGTPIANRTRHEIEGLIGFFVNTLVIRTDLSGQPTYRELLGRVRNVALAAYAHQDLPFELLVDEVQPNRDLSHTPLFQVMFALQDDPLQAAQLPDLRLSPVEIDTGSAPFDLTLTLSRNERGLRGRIQYSTDLFDADRIERMAGHYLTLLQGIVEQPDQPISRLPLLTAGERRQMLVDWNATSAPIPDNQCFQDLFAAQVARTPEAIALRFEGTQLSYQELDERANQLAHHLQRLGVGPDMLVGLCLERSIEMVTAILAVLKAGGAFLPLDPLYPQDRLAFMLSDSQASMLITQAHLIDRITTGQVQTLVLKRDWSAFAGESTDAPANGVTPEHLAYVIYTSGSTGRPKGALLHHRGLVNLALAAARTFQMTASSRMLQFAAFSFDASILEVTSTFLSGACLVLAPKERLNPGPELVALLSDEQITTVILPPSALAALPSDELPRLTTVISAGEQCSEQIVARWAPGRHLFNAYGPTECSVCATIYRCQGVETGVPPIGRPIANSQLYVLDQHQQPVPIGVPGELYIGGIGVGYGYLNRPELTNEKFVADPYSTDPSGRLYKTGDLVRYRRDGNIEFLGRMDHQVKVRGFRIELGEIEAALGRHPAIRETVVIVREDTPGDRRLVAYAVMNNTHQPTVTELRRFLGEKLPDYMLPAAIVSLDAFPLMPNGKVDRNALPVPESTRPNLAGAYAEPRTDAERTLAQIWAGVIGLDRVGIHDNFFELGGDSILGIQIIARANQAGLRLAPRDLFAAQTIAELADLAGTHRAVSAEQGEVTGPVPLTPIQQWFFEIDVTDRHHWNQALLVTVQRRLDIEIARAAVAQILAHHDALRARFRTTGDGWQQSNVGVGEDVPVDLIDLTELTEADARAAVTTTSSSLQASLNLEQGPLLRVAYFDLGPDRPGRLLFIAHHLVVDGISWRLLMEDFQTVYQQLEAGQSVQLPAKTTSFRDWSMRLSEYAQSNKARAEADYWLALPTVHDSPLPTHIDLGPNVEGSASTIDVALSRDETRALLHDVPPVYRTEINDALLAALGMAVYRTTGSQQLLLNLEGHGREDLIDGVDISRTVGWFTTAFPVVLDLQQAGDTGAMLKAVKENLRGIPNRGFGFGVLRYLSADRAIVDRLREQQPPEITFNYLGQLDQALGSTEHFSLATENVGATRAATSTRPFLLEIDSFIRQDRLHTKWTYSTQHYRLETMERLAAAFMESLREIIAHCQTPGAGGFTPSDFPLAKLEQAQLDRLLEKLKQPRKGRT